MAPRLSIELAGRKCKGKFSATTKSLKTGRLLARIGLVPSRYPPLCRIEDNLPMASPHTRGTGSVFLRGRVWWISYYRHGEQFKESAKSPDKQVALDLLSRRATMGYVPQSQVKLEKVKLEKLFDLVVEDYVDHEKKDTYQVRRRVRQHLKPALGGILASEFTSEHVKQYIRNRKKEEAKNSTINRELATIKRGFRLGTQMTPQLVTTIPTISTLPEDNIRTGFIDDNQYDVLKQHISRAILPLVIGYHLGIRSSEILSLTWDMVDLVEGEIRIPGNKTKNKKPRTLPIYGELELYLREARKNRMKCEYVCQWEGKQIKSFKAEWKAATKKAGLGNLLFHDLRRSAIRNMKKAGLSDTEAMAISGHLTRAVFDRYNIVTPDDIRVAGTKLANRLTGTTGTKQVQSTENNKATVPDLGTQQVQKRAKK